MKKPSNDLFDLIHTLSAQERRHFRGQIRGGDSLSAAIFDGMVAMQEYDEAALKKQLQRKPSSNQFSVAKNYLQHALHVFLLHRDQQDASAWKVRTRLQLVEILFSRELFDQCEHMLTHIERAARNLDDPSLLVEVHAWQLRIADRHNHHLPEARFKELLDAFAFESARLQEQMATFQMGQEFFFKLRNASLFRDSQAITADFAPFFQDPLREAAHVPGSAAARITHTYTHASYAFMRADIGEALHLYQSLVEEMEARPGWIQLRFFIYLDALFRLGIMFLGKGQFQEATQVLAKLKAAKTDIHECNGRLFFYITQMERSLIMMQGPWEKALQLLEDNETQLPEHQHRLSVAEYITLNFNDGLFYFLLGKFSDARKRLNRIVNQNSRSNTDFDLIAKVLLLLISEQERDQVLYQYYKRALSRIIAKHPGAYPMEEALLQGIGKVYAAKTLQDKRGAWQSLLNRLASSPGQDKPFTYFDYLSWVKSQATGISCEEIYLQKVADHRRQA